MLRRIIEKLLYGSKYKKGGHYRPHHSSDDYHRPHPGQYHVKHSSDDYHKPHGGPQHNQYGQSYYKKKKYSSS